MRKFILGTDWWTDCDDAVALRIISKFVKDKKIQLLGIGINACMPYSVSSLRGFLLAEKIENIPIGIDLEATDFGGNPPYQQRLSKKFGNGIKNSDAEDAVRLYRKILSKTDSKIEIIEIGYPQVITAVLKSSSDDISEKSGIELVRKKVSKIWMMAGKWDADGEKENNFCRNKRSRVAGKEFCEICPVPVTFLGWEVGYQVITGGNLEKSDHLHQVMVDHGSEHGRCSWDPMLVFMAMIGDEEKAGYKTVQGRAVVNSDDGSNCFIKDISGNHKYVVKKHSNSYYEEQINSIL